MKNPFSAARSRYRDIPIQRRIKYYVLAIVSVIALITITVIAIIDMNKTEVIDTSDPIESYDNITYIPVVFEDETDAETSYESETVGESEFGEG